MTALGFTSRAMGAGAFLAVAWCQPLGKGTISGSVVEGENNDPIRKAVVTLTLQGTPRRWATARTDSSGRFQFEGLPAGKYDLRAAKVNEGAAIYGADSVRELSDLITLVDGQTRNGIILRFFRRGSISGHVYDSGGEPVGNVNVSLLRPGRDLGAPVLFNFRDAQTDDRGEYRIGNLDPGKYYLRASPSPQRGALAPGQTMQVEQYYGGARDSKDASPIFLRGAESLAGIDLHLISEAAVDIRGRILGVPDASDPAPTQPPRDGPQAMIGRGTAAQVSIRPVDDEQHTGWSFTVAAPEYRFQAAGLPSGRYRVEAVFTSGTKTYGASQILDLRPDSSEILLALTPATDIQGTLRLEGQASAADGRSVRPNNGSTRVQLFRPGTQEGNISAQVRPDGRFTLEQVLPGDWQLAVNPVLPGFLKSARLGDKDILLTTFEINGSNDAALNIVVSMRTATLEGEVDAASPNSKRAGILIAPVGRFHNLLRFYYNTAADDEGKFKLSGIAPGKYKIFAFEKMTPANFFAPEAVDQLDDLGETIEFAEGATLQAHPKLVPADRAMRALQ
jgi:Carboxypeptidase regulatory-like domain